MVVLFRDVQPTFDFLADVFNRVQQHVYTPAYCLRRKKTQRRRPISAQDAPLHGEAPVEQDPLSCRFYYPRELHNVPHVGRNLNPAYFVFDGQCNDRRFNNYNRIVIVGW